MVYAHVYVPTCMPVQRSEGRHMTSFFLNLELIYAFWLGWHPASANDPLLSALQSTGVVNMMKTTSTLLYGCWDPNAGPYTMQQVFFTTELSLRTRKKNIL